MKSVKLLFFFILSACSQRSEITPTDWAKIVQNPHYEFPIQGGPLNIDPSDEDKDGFNFVNIACVYGNQEALEYLFSEYKISNEVLNSNNNEFGTTPLISAVTAGCIDCVTILIKNGADTTIKNSFGKTAEDVARGINRVEILKLLDVIDHGKTSQPESKKGQP